MAAPLVTLSELSIGFHGPLLLDNVSCLIHPGERIGLLGRNGSGKTTLLRLLSGQLSPDVGDVKLASGVKVAMLQQNVPGDLDLSVAAVVAEGMHATTGSRTAQWKVDQYVERILSRMQLDGDEMFDLLSSGMKRRVLLARTLVAEPDILLLDEPTNHLDIDAIDWLEQFLGRWQGTFLFVTHDRAFLRKLAGRILEIDRGRLFDWSCDYDTFLKRKEASLAAEEKQNALFDKRLAEEEVWIRQGIKARRTRNEGRVRALQKMRLEREHRQAIEGQVQLRIDEGLRSGKLVAKVKNVSFAFGPRTIVNRLSTTVMRGDKIGIIGPNGAGKTTLLRLLLGQLQPDEGTVRLGVSLQIAYFDQLRAQLDEDASVVQNVADGYDTIQVGGKPQHVFGYLRTFLFSAERARTPVRFLSGGERNRILLARLFAKSANVIVLDEPTNDLDTETLEMLEQRLVEFEGTILLVSHDREFLNNVVTSTMAFESDGLREYVGGYDDWLRQRPPLAQTSAAPKIASKKVNTDQASSAANDTRRKRLTYKQQQELIALPDEIERIERQIDLLHTAMADPAFYQQSGDVLAAEQARLRKLESDLAAAYARWEQLEQLNND